jgi:hypothetical protein
MPSTQRKSGATVAPQSHVMRVAGSADRSAVTIGNAITTSPMAASLTMRTERGTGVAIGAEREADGCEGALDAVEAQTAMPQAF